MQSSSPIRGFIWQCGLLLRIASLVVPVGRRKGWYEKWYRGVWHWAHFLHESGRLTAATRLEVIKHVWGAFADAAWQRFNREKVLKWLHEGPRTPRFCLLAITTLLLIGVIATGFAPTIRSSFSRLPYRTPQNLAHLSFSNHFIRIHSDSLFLAALRWAGKSKTAETVSAYSWEPSAIAAGRDAIDVISARVSPEFFDTLGVGAAMGRLFHEGDQRQCADCIVLSNQLWRYGFHRDPAIIGKHVTFDDRPFIVVGVLQRDFGFISPEISVWKLIDTQADAFTTAERSGMVLRLRPGASMSQANSEFSKLVAGTSGIELSSIRERVHQGTQIYILFTVLALMGSLAVLAYRIADSSGPKVHLRLRDNYRWWLFFAVKTVLLLAACFVASLEGTRRAFLIFMGVVPPMAGAICTWLFLVTTVLTLTWSLHDQCRRCRLCLKRLGYESYVGVPARLLLDWWGTELVCSQGHGMLHVPQMHASWLEMEHWTPLDDSWKPLFESEKVKA